MTRNIGQAPGNPNGGYNSDPRYVRDNNGRLQDSRYPVHPERVPTMGGMNSTPAYPGFQPNMQQPTGDNKRTLKIVAGAAVASVVATGVFALGFKKFNDSPEESGNVGHSTSESYSGTRDQQLKQMDSWSFVHSPDITTADRVDYGISRLKKHRDDSEKSLHSQGYSFDLPGEDKNPNDYTELEIANLHAVDLYSLWKIRDESGIEEARKVATGILDPENEQYKDITEMLDNGVETPIGLAKELLDTSGKFYRDDYTYDSFTLNGNGNPSIVFTVRTAANGSFQQVAAQRVNGKSDKNKVWRVAGKFSNGDKRFNFDLRNLGLK